jgi:hypothetical protein
VQDPGDFGLAVLRGEIGGGAAVLILYIPVSAMGEQERGSGCDLKFHAGCPVLPEGASGDVLPSLTVGVRMERRRFAGRAVFEPRM